MKTTAQMMGMLMSTHVVANLIQILEPGVEESLKEIEANLQEVLARRERILKTSRDCISFCSKAIVHIHTGKAEEAHREIKEAEKILKSMRKEASGRVALEVPAVPRGGVRRGVFGRGHSAGEADSGCEGTGRLR